MDVEEKRPVNDHASPPPDLSFNETHLQGSERTLTNDNATRLCFSESLMVPQRADLRLCAVAGVLY